MTSAEPQAAAAPDAPDRPRRQSPWMLLVAVVVMLAGLLFGYDQGVISGALDGIQKSFRVSTFLLEVITSWVTLGAMAGALVAGDLADRVGRRWTILLAALLFCAGSVLEAAAPSSGVLVAARVVLGLGVGVASVAAPLYAAEQAPSRLRGRFVSLYQLAITFGIMLAYLIDYLLSHEDRWRVMLGLSVVPGVLLVIAIWPLPDSPRWYVTVGRTAQATAAVRRLDPGADADRTVAALAQARAADGHRASWGDVFATRWRRPLLIGVSLAVLQQLTGINAIIYYSDKVFAAAGFASPTKQTLATLFAIGVVNFLATFVAVAYVDRFGRKPLLLIGSVGMGLSLVVVGVMFTQLGRITTSTAAGTSGITGQGLITLVALVVFIACFAFSLGPVVWTVINEIYPTHVRGRGVAVATGANWFAAWVVSQFFLTLVHAISEAGTFFLFAGFCAATFFYVSRFVPETKGMTLEQVEGLWNASGSKR